MNFMNRNSAHEMDARVNADFELEERELAGVLGDFRRSAHAWSEAEFSRQRKPMPVRRPLFGFRLASASAVLLLAAGITGGIAVRQRNADVAIQQARQNAEKRRQADEQAQLQKIEREKKSATSQNDDALLDAIDSDVAQESPAAMEPLASLMGR